MTKTIPESAWAAELHRFTSRNAGRATRLEVDSPDFGAHERGPGFPLRVITYDAFGGQVLITLGSDRQLTHSITNATGLFVFVDVRGRDEALAIKQKDSSTLLRFIDL